VVRKGFNKATHGSKKRTTSKTLQLQAEMRGCPEKPFTVEKDISRSTRAQTVNGDEGPLFFSWDSLEGGTVNWNKRNRKSSKEDMESYCPRSHGAI